MIASIVLRFRMVLFGLFVIVVGVVSPKTCAEAIKEIFGQ